jgi:hypothetical protein
MAEHGNAWVGRNFERRDDAPNPVLVSTYRKYVTLVCASLGRNLTRDELNLCRISFTNQMPVASFLIRLDAEMEL